MRNKSGIDDGDLSAAQKVAAIEEKATRDKLSGLAQLVPRHRSTEAVPIGNGLELLPRGQKFVTVELVDQLLEGELGKCGASFVRMH